MTKTNQQREEVLRRVENYVPNGTDDGAWEHIADFVRNTAVEAVIESETGSKVFVADPKSSLDVSSVLWVLIRAAAHAFNSGREVNAVTVLGEANVNAVLAGLKSATSVGRERDAHQLVAEALNGQELSRYHRREFEKSPVQPYEPSDWQRLHHWVISQFTELRRERAAVIVGLDLGAALGSEVALVKARGVTLCPQQACPRQACPRQDSNLRPSVPETDALIH